MGHSRRSPFALPHPVPLQRAGVKMARLSWQTPDSCMQLISSASLILAVVLWGLIGPGSLGAFFDQALAAITRHFGWLYLWIVLGLVVMALLLAFSRYGSLKLGGEDDEPRVFASLPGSRCCSPPAWASAWCSGVWPSRSRTSSRRRPALPPRTPEAANAAMRYSFFHWGLHPWAVYSIIALAIAFFQFRRGGVALVSAAIEALPWRLARRSVRSSTCWRSSRRRSASPPRSGMGALQINSGLHAVAGVPINAAWQVGIIVFTTALFIALGGQRRRARHQVPVDLQPGPGRRCWRWRYSCWGRPSPSSTPSPSTLGSYLSEFVRMSLRTTPFREQHLGRRLDGLLLGLVGLMVALRRPVHRARLARSHDPRIHHRHGARADLVAVRLVLGVRRHGPAPWRSGTCVPIDAAVQADVSTALFAMFDTLPLGTLHVGHRDRAGAGLLRHVGRFGNAGARHDEHRRQPRARRARVKVVWGVLVAGDRPQPAAGRRR